MGRNFHRKPFGEATRTKLGLFRDYTREWLPVWLSQARPGTTITIADFYAGPGQDSDGFPGSPLIALGELRRFDDLIRSSGAKVKLLLNEKAKTKAADLRATIESQSIASSLCTFGIRSLDFEDAFAEAYPELQAGPNLLILAQQGMKGISDRVFQKILKLPRTDFLFFVASSHLRRFEMHPNIQRHLEIPRGAITNSEFNDTHRAVTRYYRDMATSKGEQYFLGTFSIKKGSNIYGVIFGSHHPLGFDKFLRVCWKVDPERGEANFDIDADRLVLDEPRLWAEMDQPRKLTMFRRSVQGKILNGEIKSDRDVYLESLQEGVLPAEGRAVLLDLVKSGRVRVVGGQPRVSMLGYDEPRNLEVVIDGAI